MRRFILIAALAALFVGMVAPASASTEKYPGYSSEVTVRWADYDDIINLHIRETDGMGEYFLDIDLSICEYEPAAGGPVCWNSTGQYNVTNLSMTKRGGSIDAQVQVEQRFVGPNPPTQWVSVTGEWKMTQPDIRRSRHTDRGPDGWWRSIFTTYTDDTPDLRVEFDVIPTGMPMPPIDSATIYHYSWTDTRGGN